MINMSKLNRYADKSLVPGDALAQSVHNGQTERIDEAKKQLANPLPADNVNLLKLLNEILTDLGLDSAAVEVEPPYDSKYDTGYVWIKFAKNEQHRYVGVVANGPVNFQKPSDSSHYADIDKHGQWLYNASGILIDAVGLEWDTEKIIVMPVGGVPVNEAKLYIGNFLLENDIAIIDKFSHRYFPN